MVEWYQLNKREHSYLLGDIYAFFGHSKQSYYQQSKRLLQTEDNEMEIVQQLISHRLRHPVMGLRKCYTMLKPSLGRDKFYALARKHHLLACLPRNTQRTTYPVRFSQITNLLVGKKLNDVNQVWVTDITYFRVSNKFYYLTFMMDLYSRKIVASLAAPTLQAQHSLKVLKDAIEQRQIAKQSHKLIHHSDKGSQYFCNDYLALLSQYNISRSASNTVLENAHAERLNGIIKNEYLEHFSINSIEALQNGLQKAVRLYNEERPHNSLEGVTPVQFEKNLVHIPIKNRQILTVFTLQKVSQHTNQIALFQDDSLISR